MAYGIDRGEIREIDDNEAEYEISHPENLYGSHLNLIPIQSAVHAPRLFYGARFFNQAMPLKEPEAPLVQNLMSDGVRSFDEKMGEFAGAIRAEEDGEVVGVDDNFITYRGASGQEYRKPVFKNLPFNRKSAFTRIATVKPGDQVKKGGLLARSNFTDAQGNLALGVNARVGLVPFKGWSMDDAKVISEDFAKKLTSEHSDSYVQDYDDQVKGGVHHYVSLFPHKFTKEQLAKLNSDGVVTPGTVVRKGDPLFLATKPKAVSSQSAALGKLSRISRQTRNDASQVWDGDEEGVVTDVGKTKDGWKVVVQSYRPAKVGDKITGRLGDKGTIAKIIPTDRMPRTVDGKPLDILFNQLGLPSRVNSAMLYEILLGKVAAKTGKPFRLPSYTGQDDDWWSFVDRTLKEHGLRDKEDVFDPTTNKLLEAPITVGNFHVSKLMHVAKDKMSGRGVASYDQDQQPSRGGGEGAQAKRTGGLENHALLAAGAYNLLRENSTLRGQKNDEYWRSLRAGQTPKPPGTPFVFDKFMALLNGSGLLARKMGNNKLRLGPMTDKELDRLGAVEVKKPDMIDPGSLEPVAGGLFDTALVSGNRYGKITLPEPLPNPAYETQILKLLGITKAEYREILAGKMELPENLR